MCLAINTIRFCTCKDHHHNDFSIGKWFYKRGDRHHVPGTVIGRLVSPEDGYLYHLNKEQRQIETQYIKYFSSLLENKSVFDFDIQYFHGDSIVIKLKNKIKIEIFYSDEGWTHKDKADGFQRKYRIMRGKIISKLTLEKEGGSLNDQKEDKDHIKNVMDSSYDIPGFLRK